MKLFCAQVASIWDDPAATLRKVEPFIARASRAGGDLVCFPEQFATGWDPASTRHSQDIEGPIISRLEELAIEYSIAILGSFRESCNQHPRNTCAVISSGGDVIATYSKCHLFTPADEDRYFSRGDGISLFSISGMRFGLAICYDLRFASLFRLYADEGAQAVLVPAAWPEGRLDHWELFIRARALEYQIYVAGINTTGITPVDSYAGNSLAADPMGGILCRAGREETLLCCDLNPEFIDRVRSALPVARDRRDDLSVPKGRRRQGSK